jgi:prepilin-type N-terminal cleavage/methylation domain-containing protein
MRRRAFTLIEVLVVLGIVAMLAGSVFAFMLDLLRGRERLLDASREAQAAAAVIERLESDLLVTFVGSADASGVSGDGTSLRVSGRAVAFGTRETSVEMSDAQSCELRYDERAWRLEGRRWSGAEPAEFETICDRVEACRFRYFDGRRWVGSFDSARAGTLPVAIEIAAWFGAPPAPTEEELLAQEEAEELGDEAMMMGLEDASLDEPRALPVREPDLLRVMVVPDGPVAAWRESP